MTLTIPITPTLIKTYTLPPTFTSRREVKDAVARLALRDGVVKLYADAFKQRLETESGGYLDFSVAAAEGAGEGGAPPGVEGRDAIAVLNKACTECSGNVKPLVWKFQHAKGPAGEEEEGEPHSTAQLLTRIPIALDSRPPLSDHLVTSTSTSTQRYGVTLTILLHPTGLLTFHIPATHHSRQHVRMAAAAAALRGGAVEAMKEAKSVWGERAGVGSGEEKKKGKEKEKKKVEKVPVAGSVRFEDLKELTK